jgi:hypothetical protein
MSPCVQLKNEFFGELRAAAHSVKFVPGSDYESYHEVQRLVSYAAPALDSTSFVHLHVSRRERRSHHSLKLRSGFAVIRHCPQLTAFSL